MASMWRRAMLYLGLGPDEEYDEEYDDGAPARSVAPVQRYGAGGAGDDAQGTGTVRTLTPQPVEAPPGVVTRPRTGVVRPLPPTTSAKPHVVTPGSFNDAQEIGDKFKGSVPVIVNLQNVDRDLCRRIIDFAAGLCYGVGGTIEKVATQVYLLTPSNVEISAEERRRLQERGLYD